MKRLLLLVLVAILLCAFGCGSKHQSVESDPLAQYRDTLIGNFNGLEVDTLIAEPIDTVNGEWNKENLFEGWHYKWRVFTKQGSVKDLILDKKTIGIHFVNEGDLDGNGTDEWGYITEWPTSNWMCYHAFTNINGEWQHIIEPTPIYLPHIDPQDSPYYTIKKEDILQSSENAGFLKVKFSDVRNDGENFLIIDTLIRICPQKVKGFE